jgi:hypothetical protein
LSGTGRLPPVETDVSVANNPGLRRMIAGSIANNVGLIARQLHLIPVENCADCRFVGFRLQAAQIGVSGKSS